MIRESLDIARQDENAVLIGYAQRSLGEVYIAKDRHQLTEISLAEALQVFRDANMPAEAKITQQLLESLRTTGHADKSL